MYKLNSRKFSSFRNLYIEILFFVITFICVFTFFSIAHPMFIYDTDDWTYISYSRQALPSVNQWNPTKILPETLMPLVSEIGVRFVYPITNDYIGSLALVFALTISLIIMFYIGLMLQVVKEKYGINSIGYMIIGWILLLYHFLPFLVSETQNRYMFYGGNVNCFFNYIIPGLFNAILVLVYLRENRGVKIMKIIC